MAAYSLSTTITTTTTAYDNENDHEATTTTTATTAATVVSCSSSSNSNSNNRCRRQPFNRGGGEVGETGTAPTTGALTVIGGSGGSANVKQTSTATVEQQQQQQQQSSSSAAAAANQLQRKLCPTTMVALQEVGNGEHHHHHHHHHHHRLPHHAHLGHALENGSGENKPEPVDNGEDLSYGPGIVSKLRCRYLSLALRESHQQQHKQRLQRSTSLNTLMDRDDEEEVVIEPSTNQQQTQQLQLQQQQQVSLKPTIATRSAAASPATTTTATTAARIGGGGVGGDSQPQNKLFTQSVEGATTAESAQLNGSGGVSGGGAALRSRHFKRGNEVMKRARSVEALLCERSPWNTQRASYQAPLPATTGTSSRGSSTTPTCVTIEDKIHNARERLHSGTDPAPPKRLTSIIDDTERPPPDLVKQTLKMFEASANRRPRPAQRNNGVGGVASKVASYKSIIKEQSQARSPVIALKSPSKLDFDLNLSPVGHVLMPKTRIGNPADCSTPINSSSGGGGGATDRLARQLSTDSPMSGLTKLMGNMHLECASESEQQQKQKQTELEKAEGGGGGGGGVSHPQQSLVTSEDQNEGIAAASEVPPNGSSHDQQQQQQQQETHADDDNADDHDQYNTNNNEGDDDVHVDDDDDDDNDNNDNISDSIVGAAGSSSSSGGGGAGSYDKAAAASSAGTETQSGAAHASRSFEATDQKKTKPCAPAVRSSNSAATVATSSSSILASSGRQVGVIRPLFTSAQSGTGNSSIGVVNTAAVAASTQGGASPLLTSREIEKNRINAMKKSTALAADAAAAAGTGSVATSLDTVINTKTSASSGEAGSSETDATASPIWALRKRRQNQGSGGGVGGGATGGAGGNSGSENTSMVFNFSKSGKGVPDYIESDVVIYRRKRELPKPNEPGFVLLGDLSVETSTDSDYDDYSMCPPSPCDVEFENANIVIDGKSSIRQKPKESSFRVQFNDTLTSTFEYPSEASMIIDDPPYADPYGGNVKNHQQHLLEDRQHHHHHVTVDEIIELPTSTAAAHKSAPISNMLGNLPLGSASLGLYTPLKGGSPIDSLFQLGVTRINPTTGSSSNPSEAPTNGNNNNFNGNGSIVGLGEGLIKENGGDEDEEDAAAATEIVYSEGTQKTDLLY